MKIAKPFDKAAESKLLDAAKSMTAHIEEGQLDPDSAIAKVASEQNLPAEWVPLLVQAHNHGRTTYQRERAGPSLLDKVAEFPLASVEGVRTKLYPSEILSPADNADRTAVSDEYSKSASWATDHYKNAEVSLLRTVKIEKTASAAPIPRCPDAVMTEKFGRISKLAQQADAAKRRVRMLKMSFMASMGQLGDYFKGERAKEWAKVAYWANELFGPAGKHAMDYVAARNRLKISEVVRPVSEGSPVMKEREPYSLIKTAADICLEMIQAQKEASRAEVRRKQAHDEVFRPFVQTPEGSQNPPGTPDSILKESGSFLAGLAGGLSSGLARSMTGMEEAKERAAEEASGRISSLVGDISDPEHEQALRAVQVRAMLADMMQNDEVISGYSPEEIGIAYNELASLSPRVAMQPGALRPLLRKRLTAGAVEPFEAHEMSQLEKNIAQTNAFGAKPGVLNGNPLLD